MDRDCQDEKEKPGGDLWISFILSILSIPVNSASGITPSHH
jgi:hypothetical protein